MKLFTSQFSPRIAYAMVVLSSTFWGILWLPLRTVASYGISPIWVNAMFMALPAIMLAIFGWRILRANAVYWRELLGIGFFIGCGFVLYSMGLINGSVSKTTILFYLTPIWATIFGLFFLGETSSWRRWVMIVFALTGGALLMRLNPLAMSLDATDFYGFFSGLSWGVGAVMIRRFGHVHFIATTFSQYVLGAGAAAVGGFLLGVPLPAAGSVLAALPLTFIVAACIFLPSVLILFRIGQYVSPGLVGVLMLSEVIVAVASSWWFLGEDLDIWQWCGMTLILATGVWLGFSADKDSASPSHGGHSDK